MQSKFLVSISTPFNDAKYFLITSIVTLLPPSHNEIVLLLSPAFLASSSCVSFLDTLSVFNILPISKIKFIRELNSLYKNLRETNLKKRQT